MKKLFLAIAVFTSITAGCARTKPSKFYVLTDMAHQSPKQYAQHLNIGVGPVSLPKYLNKPEIITREHNNELLLAEFHRWAEALDANVQRVIGDNVTTMLPNSHAFNYPWTARTPIDYQVQVDIRRFEMDQYHNCVLKAQWSIFKEDKNKALVTHSKRYVIKTKNETNYRHIVALMSRNLLRMSADITRDLGRAGRR